MITLNEIPQEGQEKTTVVSVDEGQNYKLKIEQLNKRVSSLPTGKKIKDTELEKDFILYIKKNSGSFIKTQRKGYTFDNEQNVKKVWDVLMKYANYADLERCGVKLQRGELLATYKLLAKQTGLNEEQVRYAVSKLETKYKELYRVSYRGVQIYYMLKYEEYQGKKPKLKQPSFVIHPLVKQPVYNVTLAVDGNNIKEILYILKDLASGKYSDSDIIKRLLVVDKNTGEVYSKYESSMSVEMKYENNIDFKLLDGNYIKFSSTTSSAQEKVWDSIDNDKLIGYLERTKEEETEKKIA